MAAPDSQQPSQDGLPPALPNVLPDVLIVLDTETTGLDHKTEKIIEIGAVRLENGVVTETFSSLVNPQKQIRHSSFLIHGIEQSVVDEAPDMETVLPQLLEFVGEHTYVAHNALFDYSFINEACKSILGHKFKNPRIDSYEMFKSVFPDEISHGLSALLARFGMVSDVKHRALDDAMCLANVFPKLNALYEQKYQWQLAQLPNVHYLVERYLRIQKAIQSLQAEMADLKDVFKLHFQQGGHSIVASSGEKLVSSYRRSYTYDEAKVWDIALEAGLQQKLFKLNPKSADRLIDRMPKADLVREALLDARLSMNEGKNINIIKPQVEVEEEESSDEEPAEPVAT